MRIVNHDFEILTPISEGGIKELQHIERIARVCYKSEGKITADGESAKKFVRALIKSGHTSTIEHSSISIKLITDRAVSHELVRHRVASYSQESQRYVNYTGDKAGNQVTFVKPSVFAYGKDYNDILRLKEYSRENFNDPLIGCGSDIMSDTDMQQYVWLRSCVDAEGNYFDMIDSGAKPELARSVLPNSTKTEITITCNYRELRNILDLRCDNAAHPDIRFIMKRILIELCRKIPVVFDDLYWKYIKDYKESLSDVFIEDKDFGLKHLPFYLTLTTSNQDVKLYH